MCPLSRIPASVSRKCQCGLAIEERAIPQILAIVLDQVKGVEDRGSSSLPAAQLFEARHPIGAQHNRLAVDREAFRLDSLRRACNHRELGRQINRVAAVEPHNGPIQLDDQPVAVVLDFVDPIGDRLGVLTPQPTGRG